MPVSKKVPLEYKLDPASKVGSFIEWYEITYRTTNENGRKRKGNARKKILEFLEGAVLSDNSMSSTTAISSFKEVIERYKEERKLPPELQSAKNSLSADEYEKFKELYQKIKDEDKKVAWPAALNSTDSGCKSIVSWFRPPKIPVITWFL